MSYIRGETRTDFGKIDQDGPRCSHVKQADLIFASHDDDMLKFGYKAGPRLFIDLSIYGGTRCSAKGKRDRVMGDSRPFATCLQTKGNYTTSTARRVLTPNLRASTNGASPVFLNHGGMNS